MNPLFIQKVNYTFSIREGIFTYLFHPKTSGIQLPTGLHNILIFPMCAEITTLFLIPHNLNYLHFFVAYLSPLFP